jgi:hypothetical protein
VSLAHTLKAKANPEKRENVITVQDVGVQEEHTTVGLPMVAGKQGSSNA